METIKIPFTGINRSIDDGMSTDGQCMELINARIKNGMVEPIAKPVVVGTLPVEASSLYYHSNAKKYIAVNKDTGYIYYISEDFDSCFTITQRNNVAAISFVGNILCMSDEKGIEYAIWNGESYDFLGEMPELPSLRIVTTSKVRSVCPDVKFLGGRVSGGYSTEQFQRTAQYNAIGYFDNCIDTLNKEKYIFGACLFRYGLRTASGEYIQLSQVMLCEDAETIVYPFLFGEDTAESTVSKSFSEMRSLQYSSDDPNNATLKDYTYEFGVMGTRFQFMPYTPGYDLSKWKSLIVSVDVFAAPVHWYVKEEKKYNTLSYYEYERRDEKEAILDAYQFRKVAELDLTGNVVWELEDWSTDNLALQELLTEEGYTPHPFSAECSYVYNSRLHVANLKQTIFKGYKWGPDAYYNRNLEFSGLWTLDVYTTIDTEQGKSVVKQTATMHGTRKHLSPFMSYPDTRASEMTVVYNDGGTVKSRTFTLKKHPYLSIAYYLDTGKRLPEGQPAILIDETACYIDPSTFDADTATRTESNTAISRPNVLKVSSLNNPLSFPAAQTYQPSQGEIIGMQSNTTALSQGQFGQYPLYVFSSDGVYAMQVSTSGDVVYSSQTPVSRDVCINHNSIAGIDSAVVFASKRGLMIISGTTVTLLSGKMDGYLPSCVNSSPIITKVATVAGFEDALSAATFHDYIQGASVGYNYQENELIVTNPEHPYAYAYNFNSEEWAKISPNPKLFVNRYPECYGVIDNVVYDMQNNHRSIATVLMLTKPIKMGTLAHKRILQSALRGIVKRSLSDLYLRGEPVMFREESLEIFSDVGLYILGSNDAEHFTLVSGKESIADIRDLVTKMNKSKAYKYFMVALAGGVRTDVSLNYMEFIASESFANRLR